MATSDVASIIRCVDMAAGANIDLIFDIGYTIKRYKKFLLQGLEIVLGKGHRSGASSKSTTGRRTAKGDVYDALCVVKC